MRGTNSGCLSEPGLPRFISSSSIHFYETDFKALKKNSPEGWRMWVSSPAFASVGKALSTEKELTMTVTKKEGVGCVCVCVCVCGHACVSFNIPSSSQPHETMSYCRSKYRHTAHHLCDGFEPYLHHQLDLVLAGTPTHKGVMGPELNVSLGAKDT
jgi:hypothetical protein